MSYYGYPHGYPISNRGRTYGYRPPMRERGWFVALVAIGITGGTGAILYALLNAAQDDQSAEQPAYVTICEDTTTGERVDDSRCPEDITSTSHDGGSSSVWVFVFDTGRDATVIPRVGEKIAPTLGTRARPPGITRVQRGSVPAQGQTIQRGGFGIRGVTGSSGS